MMKMDIISKKWMDERRMESLLEGMRCLEVGSFEGEWSEHEIIYEWMRAALEFGGLMDDDDAMTGVEKDGDDEIDDIESMQTIDNDSMMEEEEMIEEDGECYEDWLAKELLAWRWMGVHVT